MRIIKTITLAVLLGLLIAASGITQEVSDRGDGTWGTRELSARISSGSNRQIVIRSVDHLSGKMHIEAGPVNEVTVLFHKIARTRSQSRAIDYIDLISIALERLPQAVRLDFRAPNPPPWNPEREAGLVDAKVIVPLNSTVEIEAVYFDITVLGPLKGLRVPSSLGRFDVTDVSDQLDISTANRRVNLARIGGSISVVTSNSPITAEDITCELMPATFRNENGDIKIDGFTGPINVKNQYGRINISGFHPQGERNIIRSVAGPVTLDIAAMASGRLIVSCRHEDIDLTIPDTLQAFFSLAVDDEGSIQATGFPFTTDLVQRNRLSLVSGDGRVEISGSIRGQGNIYVHGIRGD